MAAIHESTIGNTLAYLPAARFDQQETTRPHLDGGPDECFLMLGYEPSAIESDIEIYDYARCAFDLDLSHHEDGACYERGASDGALSSGSDKPRPVMPMVKCRDRRMAGVAEQSPSPGAARRRDLPVAP